MTPKSIQAKVNNGKIEFYDSTGSEIWLELMEGQEVEIKKVANTRTTRQNNALHLWFEQVSEKMIEAGIDMRTFFKVPLPATPEIIKENMWKFVQRKITGKESTTELTTDEINLIHKILDEAMARELHFTVPFPSEPDERYS